ncbi:hypothetical protein ABEG18_02375 [Alsobacter sp. KACC 23698]|uniref:Uncharacterized protein n=1 Tax=Alsobacter sp. KACC 23698 TaxID=3149229 RepID=A0AAU7JHI7_9HYPH
MISLYAPPSRGLRALALALLLGASAPALAQTVSLDPLTIATPEGGALTLSKVEATDTNLTRDELAKLFNKDAPAAEKRAIAKKAKAARLSLGDVVSEAKDQRFVVKGLEARGVDSGRIARLSFTGAESTFRNEQGDGKLAINGLTVDGLDLSHLMAAAETGQFADGALKIDRIAFDGFEGSVPDSKTPKDAAGGNLTRVKLGSMSLDASYAGDIPTKTAFALRSLVIQPAPASELATSLKGAGLSQLEMGMTFSGTYDTAAKTYSADDITLSLAQLGSVGLKAELAGVEPVLFTGDKAQRTAAAMSLAFSGLTVRVVNGGGVEKALAFAAASQNKSMAAFQAETAGMAGQIIPALLGGTASAASTGAAVAAFVSNPKSLTVTAKPKAGPLSLVEAAALGDPMAVVQRLAITAVSEGAAAPAPKAGAAAAPSAAPAPKVAQAAPAAGKLTGLAALNAVIGNTVSGKNADGDAGVWFYDKKGAVKQLVDDEITVGKWAIKGEKICEEYPEDDEETCYTVDVSGNVATFADEDGNGRRYTIAAGNAKNL